MDIRQLLTETVYMKASDLHLCPGQPPKIRAWVYILYDASLFYCCADAGCVG